MTFARVVHPLCSVCSRLVCHPLSDSIINVLLLLLLVASKSFSCNVSHLLQIRRNLFDQPQISSDLIAGLSFVVSLALVSSHHGVRLSVVKATKEHNNRWSFNHRQAHVHTFKIDRSTCPPASHNTATSPSRHLSRSPFRSRSFCSHFHLFDPRSSSCPINFTQITCVVQSSFVRLFIST
jgi:hypothetical protein